MTGRAIPVPGLRRTIDPRRAWRVDALLRRLGAPDYPRPGGPDRRLKARRALLAS